MPYLTSPVPYFRCLDRREYTRNLKDRHGEFIPAIAYGVRCVRGQSLWFQCMFMESSPNNTGGASFLLPIEALVTKPCPKPDAMTYIQEWDTFSSDFGICQFDFISACYALPGRVPARVLFTIDFTGTDLADDSEQHKCLHVCALENGLIGAFPNNRLLFRDDAVWQLMDQAPDFVSLSGDFWAEGMPPPLHKEMAMADPTYVTTYVGAKKPTKKKPAPKPKKKGK